MSAGDAVGTQLLENDAGEAVYLVKQDGEFALSLHEPFGEERGYWFDIGSAPAVQALALRLLALAGAAAP